MKGPKIVYEPNRVLKVQVKVTKEQPRILEKKHFLEAKTSKIAPYDGGNRRLVGWSTPLDGCRWLKLKRVMIESKDHTQSQTMDQ